MTTDSLYFASPQSDFDQWFATARRAAAGGYTRDAILGGLRARLYTNQLAVAEAWSETFFGPQEWQTLVRQAPPPQPAICLYAAEIPEHEPLAAIHPMQPIGVMLNRMESDIVLDAIVALAAHELGKQAGWVVQGTCVEAGGRAVVVTGPGHAAVSAEIATQAHGQIAIANAVLVRITLTRQVDGVQLAPTRIITERGKEITGARILQWLRREAHQEPRADVFCLTLDGRDEPVMARDLDLDRCVEPYAYPLTRTRHWPAKPPRVTDAVALKEKSHTAALSVDARTFIARLAADPSSTSQEVVREVALTIECHVAGAVEPPDQRLQAFIEEVAKRLLEG